MAYFVFPFMESLWSYLYWFFRPYIKGFLRRTTKLCEIQRVCYGEPRGARRTLAIEYSLKSTRNVDLKDAVVKLNNLTNTGRFSGEIRRNSVEYAFRTIVEVKYINLKVHKMLQYSLKHSLTQMFGYNQLKYLVEEVRKIPYNSENTEHEEKLLMLWEQLMPQEKLEKRISKQWGTIGFQGDDPKTDFRGMGILGLENLLYLATNYNKVALHVLTHSQHPTYGYSLAIVGINLTSMAYQLLNGDVLKAHFFNAVNGPAELQHFHQLYCYIFYEFDKMWIEEKPRDVMEFNRIRDKFEESLREKLSHPTSVLKINVTVETL